MPNRLGCCLYPCARIAHPDHDCIPAQVHAAKDADHVVEADTELPSGKLAIHGGSQRPWYQVALSFQTSAAI
jgi:hypothetical protein